MHKIVIAFILALALVAGCKSEAQEAKPVEMVEVSKEGTKYDPAVEKSQVPSGSFICDMGTVHYARSEKGDGKCVVCGMELVEHKH